MFIVLITDTLQPDTLTSNSFKQSQGRSVLKSMGLVSGRVLATAGIHEFASGLASRSSAMPSIHYTWHDEEIERLAGEES